MQLGVHLPNFNYPDNPGSIAPTLDRLVEVAESSGATWFSVMDHYFQMETVAPAEHPMLEGYTTLGYLAARTSRLRLGLLVTGVTYRQPGLLAKIASTLDVLSSGRATLGIGAAWYDREHRGLGVAFPSTSTRFEMLEETLQICLQMWDPDANGPYAGHHYQLEETLCSPQPLSQPHPPILIGGGGERKTLRLVAQYGDACNLFASDVPTVQQKLEVLRKHCEDVGSDYDAIQKTILYQGPHLSTGDADSFLAEMEGYGAIGVDQVMVMPFDDHPDAWFERVCGPVIPRLNEIGVS